MVLAAAHDLLLQEPFGAGDSLDQVSGDRRDGRPNPGHRHGVAQCNWPVCVAFSAQGVVGRKTTDARLPATVALLAALESTLNGQKQWLAMQLGFASQLWAQHHRGLVGAIDSLPSPLDDEEESMALLMMAESSPDTCLFLGLERTGRAPC